MKQLSLDNLRTFVTVVDMAGYAKAGELLGKSQPAISIQIKRLEQQLATKLFTKQGQRQVVNMHGRKLYQSAQQLLALNDEILAQFQPKSITGRLRLGIPSEFATTLLPSIIGEFSQLYPDVSLEVTSALSKSLLREQQDDQYDLIMALVDPEQDIAGQVIINDQLVWVGDRTIGLTDNSLSLVLAPTGCVYRSRAINSLKQQTKPWRISYTNADLTGICAAIKQGLGVSVLALSSVPEQLDVLNIDSLPPLGFIKICLVTGNTQHPQACATLADFIHSKLQSVK